MTSHRGSVDASVQHSMPAVHHNDAVILAAAADAADANYDDGQSFSALRHWTTVSVVVVALVDKATWSPSSHDAGGSRRQTLMLVGRSRTDRADQNHEDRHRREKTVTRRRPG